MGNRSWKNLDDVMPHIFWYEPRGLTVVHEMAAFMLACLDQIGVIDISIVVNPGQLNCNAELKSSHMLTLTLDHRL